LKFSTIRSKNVGPVGAGGSDGGEVAGCFVGLIETFSSGGVQGALVLVGLGIASAATLDLMTGFGVLALPLSSA